MWTACSRGDQAIPNRPADHHQGQSFVRRMAEPNQVGDMGQAKVAYWARTTAPQSLLYWFHSKHFRALLPPWSGPTAASFPPTTAAPTSNPIHGSHTRAELLNTHFWKLTLGQWAPPSAKSSHSHIAPEKGGGCGGHGQALAYSHSQFTNTLFFAPHIPFFLPSVHFPCCSYCRHWRWLISTIRQRHKSHLSSFIAGPQMTAFWRMVKTLQIHPIPNQMSRIHATILLSNMQICRRIEKLEHTMDKQNL